jgi:hypothetical protein
MPQYFWAPADCKQTLKYKVENITPGQIPTNLPNFLKYDPVKHQIKLEGADFSESDKEYQLRFVAETVEDPWKNEGFKFKITTTFLNTPPSFLSPTVD